MSKYLDNDKFLEPQVNQYGRNMVMTNVVRGETKHKYINIDTKFRDEYNQDSTANYNITLPERITNVKSIIVSNAEIPLTFYNISESLGNNCFAITSDNIVYSIVIPDGAYGSDALISAINENILAVLPDTTLIYDIFGYFSRFQSLDATITIHFDVDKTGVFDKYNFKSKLGWTLGFRKQQYTIEPTILENTIVLSESFINLNGPKYVYLVIDEFSQKNPNSFISPQSGFLMSKNILARIAINTTVYGFGAIMPANVFNGYLLTDKRKYSGLIDIKKFNVQLVNEIGIPLNLNGCDFSFCLEVEHE
jgi:hypothetical protein